jgi:spermidine synthase
MKHTLLGMGLLSAATLLLQVALTRIFSIAQFYHFAFLVVSLALLGFGASGSLLALFPRLRRMENMRWYTVGFAITCIVSYLFLNNFPFDSYSIAWDRKQVYLLAMNLLGLAVPFVFVGLFVGTLLSEMAQDTGRIYGVNLIGSSMGAILAPVSISAIGSERTVLLCVVLAGLAGVFLSRLKSWATLTNISVMVLGVFLLITLPAPFQIKPSPYKNISYYRLNPNTEIIATYQNASSRLNIVNSPTIHSAQGLSLAYIGDLPPQHGLLIDGDNMLPVSQADHISEELLDALPVAIAYTIRPNADVVMLGSGGGIEAWVALANEAQHVTIVEPNELVYAALTDDLRDWAGLADNPSVQLQHEEIRTFAQQDTGGYDIVQLVLADNYRPISSGAFTLIENYTLTVEGFRSYLDLANEDGLLVLNRWLQLPPSESLRVLGIILEALDVPDPTQHIVVFRSFQVATFIVKPTPFTPGEVNTLLKAIEHGRFDLILASQMPPDMINRYARMETPIYSDMFLTLASTNERTTLFQAYTFDISPPTDDRPFFHHFFRWRQTPDIIENLGRRWQPFGGSGYFVLLALLTFTILAASIFVVIPIILRKRFRQALRQAGRRRSGRALGYFMAIGLAFLMVEIAFIQQYILILGYPTTAMAIVIAAMLLFSGLGSSLSEQFPWRVMMVVLAGMIVLYPVLMSMLMPLLLSFPMALRVIMTILLIAPVAFLMGMPFPNAIRALQDVDDLIPWAWAANGSASVVSAVLAAILAVSLGFSFILILGGLLYLLACCLAPTPGNSQFSHHG